MAKKLYDLAVKTGTYQKDGETKNRYQNIGAVMQSDDGGKFIFLSSWFNPAGIERREGSESIMVSMFKHDPDGAGGQQQQQRRAPPPAQKAQSASQDDDIPF